MLGFLFRKEDEPQFDMNKADTEYVRNASFAVGALFQSKWRIQILCALRSRPVRLGQLKRLIPEASKKMLAQNLRTLEADGLVLRHVHPVVPPQVDYCLTERGQELVALLLPLVGWAAANANAVSVEAGSPID